MDFNQKMYDPAMQKNYTARDVYGLISRQAEYDRQGAQALQNAFDAARQDRTSQFYDPYSQATNRSVNNLKAYGIDVSNINDDFFTRNDYLRQYLIYDGTTNSPTKPGRKASTAQKAAYEYYQIWKAEDATKKAESQWQALQKDVAYWATAKDRNYSDDDIINKIDWSKYGELVSMKNNKDFAPNEYNRAIGYSDDALYATIWAARNGLTIGQDVSMEQAMAASARRLGNTWKYNPEIASKLAAGTDTYAPYSVGSTMEKERQYFGRDSFDQQWVDDNRQAILGGNDETAKKYFANIVEKLEYTDGLNGLLKEMKEEIEGYLMGTSDANYIIDAIFNDKEHYGKLFELDESLMTGKLKETTSAVNYRRQDIEEMIRDACTVAEELKKTGDYVDLMTGEATTESGKALQSYWKQKVEGVYPTVKTEGTPAEKSAAQTGTIEDYDTAYDKVKNANIPPQKSAADITKLAVNDVMAANDVIYDYDSHQFALKKAQDEYEEFDAEWQALNERYEKISARSSMDAQTRQTLTDIAATDDWDYYRNILNLGEEENRLNGMGDAYNGACRWLYEEVNGFNPNIDQNVINAEAQDYFNYIQETSTEKTVANLLRDINRDGGYEDEDLLFDNGRYEVTVDQDETQKFHFAYAKDNVTGKIYGPDEIHELEVAISGEDFFSPEEEERYNMLTQRREELEQIIDDEKYFLGTNEEAYTDAMDNKNFIIQAWAAAASVSDELDATLIPTLNYAYFVGKEYVPTQYHSYFILDQAVKDETMTKEESLQEAFSSEKANRLEAQQLTELLASLDKYKAPISDEYRNNINRRIKTLQEDAELSSYYLVDGAKDFDEMVAKGKAMASTVDLPAARMLSREDKVPTTWSNSDVADELRTWADIIKYIEPQEKDRFFYLLAKDGKEAAQKYFDLLTDPNKGMITVRTSVERQNEMREFAGANGWNAALATGASFISNAFGGPLALMYEAITIATGGEISPYNSAFNLQNATTSFREGSKDWLHSQMGDSELIDMLYDAFTSHVDSAINAKITTAAFDIVGKAFSGSKLGKLLQKFMGNVADTQELLANGAEVLDKSLSTEVGKFLFEHPLIESTGRFMLKASGDLAHAATMGFNAAASAYRDAVLKGGDPDQALGMFWATFFAETGSEAITFSNLHDSFILGSDAEKRSFINFVKEFLKNGAEEFFGEGANEYFEQNAERDIMGAMSDYDQRVQELIDSGYAPSVAQQIADKETWTNILKAGAIGFISSGMGTVNSYAAGYVKSKLNQEKPETIPGSKGKLTREDVSGIEQGALGLQQVTGPGTSEEVLRGRYKGAEEDEATHNQRQLVRDSNTLVNALDSDRSTTALAVASVLGGDIRSSRAAAQNIVTNMTDGKPVRALRGMHGMLSVFTEMKRNGEQPTMTMEQFKNIITMAAMTDGKGHAALQTIMNKSSRHAPNVTAQNVTNLINGVLADQMNAQSFRQQYDNALAENRLANYTIRNLSQFSSKLSQAEKDVSKAQKNADNAQKVADDAHAAVEASGENLKAAKEAYMPENGPVNKEAAGGFEQARNKLKGDITAAQQADDALAIQQQKVAEAQEKATEERKEALATARQDAAAQVAQEDLEAKQAAEEQAKREFEDAKVKYHPKQEFNAPINVKLKDGTDARLVGVFARTQVDNGAGNPTKLIYATTNGYVTDDDIDWETTPPANVINNIVEEWGENDNPINPHMWLDRVVVGEDANGGPVNIVGIAGQMDDSVIVIDADGKMYNIDNEKQIELSMDDWTYIADTYGDNGGEESFPAITSRAVRKSHQDYRKENIQPLMEDVAYPEDMHEYPKGPVSITGFDGNEYSVIGVVDDNGLTYYVTEDGNTIREDMVADIPDAFDEWAYSVVSGEDDTDLELGNMEGTEFDDMYGFDESGEKEVNGVVYKTEAYHPLSVEYRYGGKEWHYESIPDFTGELGHIIKPDNAGISAQITFTSGKETKGASIMGIQVDPSGTIALVDESGAKWRLADVADNYLPNEDDIDFLRWAYARVANDVASPKRGNAATEESVDSAKTAIENLINRSPFTNDDVITTEDVEFDTKEVKGVPAVTAPTNGKTTGGTEIDGIAFDGEGSLVFTAANDDYYIYAESTDVNPEFAKWALDVLSDQDALNALGIESKKALRKARMALNNMLPTETETTQKSKRVPTTRRLGKKNPETGAPLYDWMNPNNHGSVKPLSPYAEQYLGAEKIPETDEFKEFFAHNSPEMLKIVANPDGTPKVIYRGIGAYEHRIMTNLNNGAVETSNGQTMSKIFFTDDFSLASSYTEGGIIKLRTIDNWETAKAAMQDIGLDLVAGLDPYGTGKPGYMVVEVKGGKKVPIRNTSWFGENDLNKFKATYGGHPTSEGLYAGYVAAEKPLIIDAKKSLWNEIMATATAPDGTTVSAIWATDSWAAWAFDHGADACVIKNVYDGVGDHTRAGTDIILSDSSMFKSVFNRGNWDYKNSDILELKEEPGTDAASAEVARRNVERAKAVANTPTAKQAKKVREKLKSPQDIAMKLATDLGFGNYIGSSDIPSGLKGYWDKHARLVAIRPRYMGTYTATFHELGHGIAQLLKMTGTTDMINNMIRENENFKRYDRNKLNDEAMAEFVWRWMESTDRAVAFAGQEFVDEFERRLMQRRAINSVVQKARSDFQAWVGATADERGASMVQYETDPKAQTFAEQLRKFVNGLADTTSIASEVDNRAGTNGELRNQALFANHAQGRTQAILKDTLTDANGLVIGDGLAKRWKDVGFDASKEEDRKLWERYCLYKASIAREENKKTIFGDNLTMDEIKGLIDQIERTRPDIVEAEKAFQKWRHEFLKAWMVDTGYWDEKVLDAFEIMYPHYIPTNRAFREKSNDETGFGKDSKKYTLHAAKGSSQNIISPMYSIISMVDKITNMVGTNQVAQVFDRIYNETPGMGVFARLVHVGNDTYRTPSGKGLNAKQQQILDVLKGNVDGDLLEQVLDITQSRPGVDVAEKGSNEITVQREDGTTARYEVLIPELYKLLSGVQGSSGIGPLHTAGKVTQMMTMLTTGANPLFAARNAVRDYQASANYGTWTSNYLTGLPKWVKAFTEIARHSLSDSDNALLKSLGKESKDVAQYYALGGGGWTRITQNSVKSMKEIQNEMFGDDTSTLGKKGKWAGKQLLKLVTMEWLNETIEQTSRFVEYKYGNHDLSTIEGLHEAFQAGQDVTVDFSRRGNSELAYILQKIIPFFNSSTQGVSRTMRQFTQAERGATVRDEETGKVDIGATAKNVVGSRAATRLLKTILNTGLMSALAAGLILKFGDDDDKEEFVMLSDGIKANHLVLPNPFKTDENGEPPFIRIPLAQDPLGYAIHNLVTNAMIKGSDDEMAISLAATADVILDNLNPLGSGTIAQPFIDVSHNRTWYGSSIVDSMKEDWVDKGGQYDEDTPVFFRTFGRLLNTSPEILEYLFSQYTGFIGAMAIPTLSNESDGGIGGLNALKNSIVRKWTTDPATSNNVTNDFYNMKRAINTINEQANADRPQGLFLRSLTQDQVNEAYEVASQMTKSGGIIYDTSKLISDTYKQIDKINANPSLTDDEKAKSIRDTRLEMVRQVEATNEILMGYYKKYIQGETLTDRMIGAIQKGFEEGKVAHVKTAIEKMPEVFLADSDALYMQRSLSVYDDPDSSGYQKAAALPHPARSFSLTDKTGVEEEYEISEDEWPYYTSVYQQEYQRYILGKGAHWDTMDEKARYNLLKSAHTSANKKMKEMYARNNQIKLK